MQRFINDPDLVVEDTVRGFVKAHSDLVKLGDNPRVVAFAQAPIRGKVGVMTGGGSGHEPAFIGYVGRNMLDAVAVGEIFSSPTAKSFYDAMKMADGGCGVVCLYGNYAGDNMNVKMAMKLAAKDGIEVQTVVANDDVCSAPLDRTREAPWGCRRDLDVEGRRRQGGVGREPRGGARYSAKGHRQLPLYWRRSRAMHIASSRPPQFQNRARKRWRSASAITASRGRGSSR